jgi:hypothetical protein
MPLLEEFQGVSADVKAKLDSNYIYLDLEVDSQENVYRLGLDSSILKEDFEKETLAPAYQQLIQFNKVGCQSAVIISGALTIPIWLNKNRNCSLGRLSTRWSYQSWRFHFSISQAEQGVQAESLLC